jgi:ubiquinone/menaquinone biosynthesis C-methylase UbiE
MSGRAGTGGGADQPLRKYGDAEGYDAYMGGWSTALSPPFIAYAEVSPHAAILDVGCGTGNLLAAIKASHPGAKLSGVDPSAALLAKARQRPELADAHLKEGTVEALPFDDGAFDFTLSLLVLQEFADRGRALGEMRRVTRGGGIVAGCQWDFVGMPVIDRLVEAITEINPAAGQRIGANSPRVFEDEAELIEWWTRAGFADVQAGRIAVTRDFPDFDFIWRTLLRGPTPSTLTLASLPSADQQAVYARMAPNFPLNAEGRLRIRAEALVVKGRA